MNLVQISNWVSISSTPIHLVLLKSVDILPCTLQNHHISTIMIVFLLLIFDFHSLSKLILVLNPFLWVISSLLDLSESLLSYQKQLVIIANKI